MIEWKKDTGEEGSDEEHYSHLAKQNPGASGEKSKIPFIIIGVGIIFLIILFFMFNPKPPQNKYPDVRPLEARIAQMEERMNMVEGLKDQIKSIEDQARINSGSQAVQQQLDNSVKANSETIAEIQKKLTAMESQLNFKPEKGQAAASERQEIPKKNQEAQQSTGQPSGDKLLHTVQKGDTLFRVSQKYGLSLQKLMEINQINEKATIYPGQKLIVGPVGKSK